MRTKSKASCPKCRSKDLTLTEHVICTTTWEQVDGYVDREEGYHGTGDVVAIFGRCDSCGHKWKFRCLQITDLVIENNPESEEPQ